MSATMLGMLRLYSEGCTSELKCSEGRALMAQSPSPDVVIGGSQSNLSAKEVERLKPYIVKEQKVITFRTSDCRATFGEGDWGAEKEIEQKREQQSKMI